MLFERPKRKNVVRINHLLILNFIDFPIILDPLKKKTVVKAARRVEVEQLGLN